MADLFATLALLLALELVLGVDNIVVISIIVSRLPAELRKKARLIGLALALLARLLMVAGASFLMAMTDPLVFGLSVRDLLLLLGGAFLLWKAVKEILISRWDLRRGFSFCNGVSSRINDGGPWRLRRIRRAPPRADWEGVKIRIQI